MAQQSLTARQRFLRKHRALVKAGTWRLIAGSTTFTVGAFLGYHFTGSYTVSVAFGSAIAIFDGGFKLVFYYLHERLWDKHVPLSMGSAVALED